MMTVNYNNHPQYVIKCQLRDLNSFVALGDCFQQKPFIVADVGIQIIVISLYNWHAGTKKRLIKWFNINLLFDWLGKKIKNTVYIFKLDKLRVLFLTR